MGNRKSGGFFERSRLLQRENPLSGLLLLLLLLFVITVQGTCCFLTFVCISLLFLAFLLVLICCFFLAVCFHSVWLFVYFLFVCLLIIITVCIIILPSYSCLGLFVSPYCLFAFLFVRVDCLFVTYYFFAFCLFAYCLLFVRLLIVRFIFCFILQGVFEMSGGCKK